MKEELNLRRFMVVVLLVVAVVEGSWQLLLARTGPVVHQLPSMVHSRLEAHGDAYISLSVMPLTLREAVVATEDRSFWTNPGIDIEGIVRSALVDVYYAQFVQGGSTITQQLARDMLLNPHKTIGRKIKEMLLALVITRSYSKQAILEMYLNEVYLGQGTYGVDSAARVYFGVAPGRLTEAQCVMLAGLPRGPSLYDPLVNWQAARDRQRQVLDNMVEAGYLTATAANRIYAQPLALARG